MNWRLCITPLQALRQALQRLTPWDRGQPEVDPLPVLLSQQIRRLRWEVPLFALLLVFAHQIVEHFWFPGAYVFNSAIELLVYGLVGPLVVWLALGWVQRKVTIKEAAESELVQAHAELTQLNRRVSFLLRVNQRLGEAADEERIAALALQLPAEIVSIVGCALVRFDEHHQPMPVEYRGALDEMSLAAWHRHLSARAVRHRCEICRPRSARAGDDCPLLKRLPLPDVESIVCLSLGRHEREFGILGLFLARGQALTREERDLLEALVAEITIAFENARLRTRELAMFYEVNEALHQRLGFNALMARILTRTVEASHADAGLLLLNEGAGTSGGTRALSPCATAGAWDGADRLPLVESLAGGALESGEPVVASLQTSDPDTASVLCAPMIADEGPLGVIILGSRRREAFLRQQMRLVSAIAGQAALLAQNARLYAQLEHQAILVERGRLAREMHDGLAQTLGYLKMRTGQIARWVEAGQTDAAAGTLRELAQTANDAYLDLRSAIDGLRLPAEAQSGVDLADRLRRLIAAFESQSGLVVELAIESEPRLSAPAEAHLLRLVQESLTNIRKHAAAEHVQVTFTTADERLMLVIEDDGQGFDPGEDVPETRHGLRSMRERASLLGAELQVVSAPEEGTRVCIEWPAVVQPAPSDS